VTKKGTYACSCACCLIPWGQLVLQVLPHNSQLLLQRLELACRLGVPSITSLLHAGYQSDYVDDADNAATEA
jgi:hypothetical protein